MPVRTSGWWACVRFGCGRRQSAGWERSRTRFGKSDTGFGVWTKVRNYPGRRSDVRRAESRDASSSSCGATLGLVGSETSTHTRLRVTPRQDPEKVVQAWPDCAIQHKVDSDPPQRQGCGVVWGLSVKARAHIAVLFASFPTDFHITAPHREKGGSPPYRLNRTGYNSRSYISLPQAAMAYHTSIEAFEQVVCGGPQTPRLWLSAIHTHPPLIGQKPAEEREAQKSGGERRVATKESYFRCQTGTKTKTRVHTIGWASTRSKRQANELHAEITVVGNPLIRRPLRFLPERQIRREYDETAPTRGKKIEQPTGRTSPSSVLRLSGSFGQTLEMERRQASESDPEPETRTELANKRWGDHTDARMYPHTRTPAVPRVKAKAPGMPPRTHS
ncbi:hypothetical protein EDB83DRAFT_2318233 [Lactarius deliciosus]|nr:hypothetical protein EDB83DRAFT_2318233 [Lactarius deliciosus]